MNTELEKIPENSNNGWLHDETLSKRKKFQWKIDNGCNIHIRREFKNSEEKLRLVEMNKLDEYMRDGNWKDLANNVEKLHNGTEKPGIGKFLHDELGRTPTEAQLSSHLGAIFYGSGVWDYNGEKKGMRFKKKRISSNWCELVNSYYEKALRRINSKVVGML